jgi:ribonuclease D
VTAIAAAHNLPVENLMTPDTVRRLAWAPPDPVTEETVAEALRTYGARAWQIGLTLSTLTAGLRSD